MFVVPCYLFINIIKLKSKTHKTMFNTVMPNKAAILSSSKFSHNILDIKLYKCCNKIMHSDNDIVAISCAILFVLVKYLTS